jgi:hypothetical protein
MGMKPSTRPVSIEQVRSLLKKSARDMKDAATPGLSSERVFTIRYEAGFSCAQAFALANKMEPPRDGGFGHHYEILEYLVGSSADESPLDTSLSDQLRLLHPCGDLALSVKHAPDIDVVAPLQIKHQVKILL